MIKTVIIKAGQETEIEISEGYHVLIENRGADVIYASKNPGVQADADGVTAIDSGSAKVLRNAAEYGKDEYNFYRYYGKIYLLSALDGKAEIQTANDLNFFSRKNTVKGGGSYDDAKIKAEISALKTDIADLQNDKVDKVSGKGLSTNDYTTAEKNKLANLENYDDTEIKSEIPFKSETGKSINIENNSDSVIIVDCIKNLINNTASSSTIYNVAYTVNSDKSITVNGTNSSENAVSIFQIASVNLEKGRYILSDNGSTVKRDVRIRIGTGANSPGSYVSETGSFSISEDGIYNISLCVNQKTTIDKVTVYPMLEKGHTAHNFVPYNGYDINISNDKTSETISINQNTENPLLVKIYSGTTAILSPVENTVTYAANADGENILMNCYNLNKKYNDLNARILALEGANG